MHNALIELLDFLVETAISNIESKEEERCHPRQSMQGTRAKNSVRHRSTTRSEGAAKWQREKGS